MIPTIRQQVEELLALPDKPGRVVSAYANLATRGDFTGRVRPQVRNRADEGSDGEIEAARLAIAGHPSGRGRGVAVFVDSARGLNKVIELDFPVEDRLVVDDEPFLLPLLEHWHGEPNFLIAVIDSDEAHLFESHAGDPHPIEDLERPDVDEQVQREKNQFIYKRRFSAARHERLQGTEDDKFMQDVAAHIGQHWRPGDFAGLILLGQTQITGPLRRMLSREAQAAVIEQAAQAMTARPVDVADDVARALVRWHEEREAEALGELTQRWKEGYHVADGAGDVLDALQQGRATRVIFGAARTLPDGARCSDCGYRFGAPIATCTYCGGACRALDVAQEILRMASRHRIPVLLFRGGRASDPLGRAGGVSALLRAEANWAPDAGAARVTEGH